MNLFIRFMTLFFLLVQPHVFHGQSEYLFSPKGDITRRIIEEINKAEHEIIIAMYMLTSQKITDALIAAKKRNVCIQLVVDNSSVQSPYGKIYHLQQAGILVKLFSPPTSNKKFPPLMHAKFAIIDQKICIEGSFNWTNSAELFNEEHIRITTNKRQIEALYTRFYLLLNERSTENFSCHPAQITAWEKKQKTATAKQLKEIETTHPTPKVIYTKMNPPQWLSDFMHFLFDTFNSKSKYQTSLLFLKKSCLPFKSLLQNMYVYVHPRGAHPVSTEMAKW